MIERVYVPLYDLVPPADGVTLTQVAAGTAEPTGRKPISRAEAQRRAGAHLGKRYRSIAFRQSGKKGALRWLEYEVEGPLKVH